MDNAESNGFRTNINPLIYHRLTCNMKNAIYMNVNETYSNDFVCIKIDIILFYYAILAEAHSPIMKQF